MQIETTISTLYNVKKCLEEELDAITIKQFYSHSEMRELKVKENHLIQAKSYNFLFDKLLDIMKKITETIYKL